MESEVVVRGRAGGAVGVRSFVARIATELAPHEVFMLTCSVFFSLLAIIASSRVPKWPEVQLYMLEACVAIVGVGAWSAVNRSPEVARWLRRIRLLYLFPVVVLYFKAVGVMAHPLHGHDFDYLMIAADRLIFGVNPTVWLSQHFPTWPLLTEYLMICYASFFFLPLALTIELYRRSQREHRPGSIASSLFGGIQEGHAEPAEQVVFIIVYGFLLSYIAYLSLPSIGPRFTLHNFLNLQSDLPGLWLTEPLRGILNRGENILPGMAMPEILGGVNRDAFPSGHTDMTALTMLLAFQFRSRLRWPIAIIGASLIFSTVYLRYHYVIDLIAGLLFAAITLYTWEWMRDRMLAIRARFQ